MTIRDLFLKGGLLVGLSLTGLVNVAQGTTPYEDWSGAYTGSLGQIGPARIEMRIYTESDTIFHAIYFAEGSADITKSANVVLAAIVGSVEWSENSSISVFCGDGLDQSLSLERMEAVANGLESHGVPANWVEIESTASLASSL